MKISSLAATQLGELMKSQRALSAETFEQEVRGVKVTFVILYHDDQRDGSWESLHCLGSNTVVTLGNIPEEKR